MQTVREGMSKASTREVVSLFAALKYAVGFRRARDSPRFATGGLYFLDILFMKGVMHLYRNIIADSDR